MRNVLAVHRGVYLAAILSICFFVINTVTMVLWLDDRLDRIQSAVLTNRAGIAANSAQIDAIQREKAQK